MMNKKIKEKWLIALKSGKYEKGKKYLLDDSKYCCLGVLCDIYATEHKLNIDNISTLSHNNENEVLCDNVKNWAGLLSRSPGFLNEYKINETLAEINDNSETFKEVIETIEKQF
jgi:hypothetical protein